MATIIERLTDIRDLVADDVHADSFQSIREYRARLVMIIDRTIAEAHVATPADAISLLRKAHRTLACAALTQIRDGEAVWTEIGRFLDAAPAEAREPVAQWQTRVRDVRSAEWVNVTEEGAKRVMSNLHESYDVRALYERPVPADAGEAVAWIAVSDRLPPARKTVIVAVEFDGPGDWRLKAGGINDEGEWCVFGASWTPTYWTEMPPSPVDTAQGAQGGKGGEA